MSIEQYKNRFFNLMESTIGDVKPLLNEQAANPGFYDELAKKGYKMTQNWMGREGLYSQIKPALVPLNGGNANTVVFFEKDLSPAKSIRFITDGKQVYFLNNQFGDGTLKGFGNGPYEVRKIRSSF